MTMASAVLALAQASSLPTFAEALDHTLVIAERRLVPAAEAMPEDQYGFAPSQGEFRSVRTFLEQVKHMAAVNYLILSTVCGERPPDHVNEGRGPDRVRTKAEAVQYLKDSYAFAHAAVAGLPSEGLLTPIENPGGGPPASRLSLVNLVSVHAMDHYGQMVVYLRMNGIIPPASRR